jgi:hypothetical protein
MVKTPKVFHSFSIIVYWGRKFDSSKCSFVSDPIHFIRRGTNTNFRKSLISNVRQMSSWHWTLSLSYGSELKRIGMNISVIVQYKGSSQALWLEPELRSDGRPAISWNVSYFSEKQLYDRLVLQARYKRMQRYASSWPGHSSSFLRKDTFDISCKGWIIMVTKTQRFHRFLL